MLSPLHQAHRAQRHSDNEPSVVGSGRWRRVAQQGATGLARCTVAIAWHGPAQVVRTGGALAGHIRGTYAYMPFGCSPFGQETARRRPQQVTSSGSTVVFWYRTLHRALPMVSAIAKRRRSVRMICARTPPCPVLSLLTIRTRNRASQNVAGAAEWTNSMPRVPYVAPAQACGTVKHRRST